MIRKILVPLNDPKTAAGLLSAAIAVGRKFNAHLHAVHVRPDPRDAMLTYGDEWVLPSVIEGVIKATEANAAKTAAAVRAAFENLCAKQRIAIVTKTTSDGQITASFEDVTDYEDRAIAVRGRVSDLLIIDRGRGRAALPREISAESALMETGRPLLLVPPKSPSSMGTNVAIAWNDTPQSARAVGLAMDFIVAASAVTIVTAKEEGVEFRPQALLELLAWHNVRAKVVQVAARGDAGKALLATTAKAGSDLLVMGAYGHSRAREWILGGVTRHVLEAASIPTLMVH